MSLPYDLDKIAISVKSHHLLKKVLQENAKLEEIMFRAKNETEAIIGIKNWVLELLKDSPQAMTYYKKGTASGVSFKSLKWNEIAAIRILDYVDNAGREFEDLNLRGEPALSDPIKLIWLAVNKGTGGAKPDFFEDMLHLFRQLTGKDERQIHTREKLQRWMERFPSGLDPRIVKLREENRDRIIGVLIRKIEKNDNKNARYYFEPGLSEKEKFEKVLEWWQESTFHLKYAARKADDLNEMLGNSLDPDTMRILYDAEKKGIPFFVNPYYLSLLHVRVPYFAIGADLAIRHYVVYSRQLVDEFGYIAAWEKEDKVEPGKPNAAGWILPEQHNIHRRYPDVAILIPDTQGRACGGLCASCQRMYDFQNGYLNFKLDDLEPKESWPEKLERLMKYFEEDAQLRDILITGGDALMSSDKSLEKVLDAVYNMARRKTKANRSRPDGQKYAELVRVRLGTRLPVYLPQRVTPELEHILRAFREKASEAGVKQFVIQTHFESPMEITPETKEAVGRLINAGWMVTNQHVFTTAASRRGHNLKLRQTLNEIGILPYYTFSVKGYMENYHNFVPNARAVQESIEEKNLGIVPKDKYPVIMRFPFDAEHMIDNIERLESETNLPLLATDRNVLNLPGVGKSLTYRVIGITRYGRRILQFEHDGTRTHSPIIEDMPNIYIIESKSISEYLKQLEEIGENKLEYTGLYGYSIGETEARMPIYEYPKPDFAITEKMTNLQLNP